MSTLTTLLADLAAGRVQVTDLPAPLSDRTPVIQLPPPFANPLPSLPAGIVAPISAPGRCAMNLVPKKASSRHHWKSELFHSLRRLFKSRPGRLYALRADKLQQNGTPAVPAWEPNFPVGVLSCSRGSILNESGR